MIREGWVVGYEKFVRIRMKDGKRRSFEPEAGPLYIRSCELVYGYGHVGS